MSHYDFFFGVAQIVVALFITNILLAISRNISAEFVRNPRSNNQSPAKDEIETLREELHLIATALTLPPTDRKKLVAQYLVTGVEILAPYAARDTLAHSILSIMNDLGSLLVTVGVQEGGERMSRESFAQDLEEIMSRIKGDVARIEEARKVVEVDESLE